MRSGALFIDGRSVDSSGSRRIERRDPRADKVVATFADASNDDVNLAVASAQRALHDQTWQGISSLERSRVLNRAADLLASRHSELAEIEAEETGKPREQATDDILRGVDLWRYAAAATLTASGEAHTALGIDGAFGVTLIEPVGVVGLITPWNFPFLVAAERLPFLLAAGCTAVWKPSEYTSGSALLTAKVLINAGVPPGVVNVVTGSGAATGQFLVEHPDVAMISFTGSSENGRSVMATASKTFKRLSLELGGKNPVIVFDDADLRSAAEAVIEGFTHNAGQCCTATTRLLVQRGVADAFEKRLAEALAERRFDQPPATSAQRAKIAKYLELGTATAARVTRALSVGDGATAPTVFVSLPKASAVRADEIFAPLLTFDTFSDEDDAIAQANNTNFGLAAAFWTGDLARGLRLAHRVKAGRIWVNSKQVNFPHLPVGGFGASGFGREAGSSGLRTYSEVKTVITTLDPSKTRR